LGGNGKRPGCRSGKDREKVSTVHLLVTESLQRFEGSGETNTTTEGRGGAVEGKGNRLGGDFWEKNFKLTCPKKKGLKGGKYQVAIQIQVKTK